MSLAEKNIALLNYHERSITVPIYAKNHAPSVVRY